MDYLNYLKIAPPDCSPKIPHLGGGGDTYIQQLLLLLRFRDNGMYQSNRLCKKSNIGQANNGNNDNYKAPEDKWKFMNFDHFSKGTPNNIQTVK